jgi:4-amino-4-deoxy-L-arabinose transferase-like glycosyltransferase
MKMPNHLKKQWIKLGLFFIACTLGVASIFFNRIELALIASLTMGFSFWNLKENHLEKEDEIIASEKDEISSGRLILTITLFIFAILFGVGTIYFSKNPESGKLSLIPWLISIALLVSAGIIFDRMDLFAWLKRIENMSPEALRHVYIEIAVVSVITQIAFMLRATSLDHFPAVMHGDEGEIGMEALRVLGIGNPISPFDTGWASLPNLFFYLPAGFINIFGRNEIGLRMVSAIFGTLCIPLVYLIGRKFWGKLAGFTGAWLISVSHFNIHYSRLGVNCIEAPFFMILFILLFLAPYSRELSEEDQGRKKSDASNFLKDQFSISPHIAVGLTCGLAQYIGIYSWLIPLVALPLYLFQFIRKRINIIQIAVAAFTAALVFAPLGMVYLQNPNTFTARMETVSIFNPDNIKNNYDQNATSSNSLFLITQNQIKRNLNFYLQSGDASSFYVWNIPAFDLITALLFWLGLGVVFSRPRRLPELALILWFVIGTIVGGALTNNAPSGTRLLTVTSVVFIIGGVFMQRTWDVLNDFISKIKIFHMPPTRLFAPMLACILMATLGINMYYYFGVFSKSAMNIVSMDIAKEIIIDAPVDHVYLLGDGVIYVNHGTIRFLAGEGKAMDLKSPEDLPMLVKDGKGITVLATASHLDEINSIKSRYPQGEMSYDKFFGSTIFIKYRIPPLNLQ